MEPERVRLSHVEVVEVLTALRLVANTYQGYADLRREQAVAGSAEFWQECATRCLSVAAKLEMADDVEVVTMVESGPEEQPFRPAPGIWQRNVDAGEPPF